jgi:hypothetical protein
VSFRVFLVRKKERTIVFAFVVHDAFFVVHIGYIVANVVSLGLGMLKLEC